MVASVHRARGVAIWTKNGCFSEGLSPEEERRERWRVAGSEAAAAYKQAFQRKIERMHELRALRLAKGRENADR